MLNQFRLREPFELLMGRTWHRPPRRARPRRMHCGLSLFEALLVMLIAVPMLQQGVRLVEGYIREQAGVQESRMLTQMITAASTFALRDNPQALITGTIGVGRILPLQLGAATELDTPTGVDALREVDALLSTADRSSLGRKIQILFYASGANELVVLAHAYTPAGETNQPYVPRGGDGIGLVGHVPVNEPNKLSGPGLNYDLSPLQAQARTQDIQPPVVGDQLAIAVLRMDQDVLPYLHRKAVTGRPELNQMQTDLDMGRKDIIGAGKVGAEQVISNRITIANQLVAEEIVTGSCEGCDLSPPDTAGETTP